MEDHHGVTWGNCEEIKEDEGSPWKIHGAICGGVVKPFVKPYVKPFVGRLIKSNREASHERITMADSRSHL